MSDNHRGDNEKDHLIRWQNNSSVHQWGLHYFKRTYEGGLKKEKCINF